MKQLVLFFFILLNLNLKAADYSYAIQLGIFFEPRLEDFESIRTLGFVYAEHTDGDAYRIYIGDYNSRREAQQMEAKLKQKGYMDAFVVEIDLRMGQTVPVVQLATRSLKERIKWSSFFELGVPIYVIADKSKVRIVSAPFRTQDIAQARLKDIKKKGFSDAFLKNINTMQLHKITAFELGDQKQPLIPINIVEGNQAEPQSRPDRDLSRKGSAPESFDFAPNAPVAKTKNTTATKSTTVAIPRIRTNVKRRSALNLQKLLKELKAYEGSLDGYYGKGTADAFEDAANNNLKFQQYKLLAEYTDLKEPTGTNSDLQLAINDLWNNSGTSFADLQTSKRPIARAYRAYWLFVNDGRSSGVNTLMNDAVGQAFLNTSPSERPPLDPKATYAYNDLEQLIRHLVFIDQADKDIKLPCWLLERHPNEARSALIGIGGLEASSIQGCYSFDQWEIVRILQTLAIDLNAEEKLDAKRMEQAASVRAQLYLAPSSLGQGELEDMLTWDKKLWESIDAWAARDPLHNKLVTPLKLAYHQTQVQLEDHYMDRDFGPSQAKGLSLAVLQSLVGYHLERF